MSSLFKAIDKGYASIGLPPYNGGLFDQTRNEIVGRIQIPDSVVADIVDDLSFLQENGERKYINYRNLSVQQLGSIYERLLEYEVKPNGKVVPNIFARKGSGSYYTPDDLVQLIISETLEPMIAQKQNDFLTAIKHIDKPERAPENRLSFIRGKDPAVKILELKICDPAMGSGHFLVSLVDYLSDNIIEMMAEAEKLVPDDWGVYTSPLAGRIEDIRTQIDQNATDKNWTLDRDQLDDRHIIRRMVLKRCVYGVDKNPMAVELAKVSLWLHTFTVGAPLSFLNHHLRCGDSLFGSFVRKGLDKLGARGQLLIGDAVKGAVQAASKMQIIENLTDAEIAEAHRSADIFDQIVHETKPLNALLSMQHALEWLDYKKDKPALTVIDLFFDGQFGDPVDVLTGRVKLPKPESEQSELLDTPSKPEQTHIFYNAKLKQAEIEKFRTVLAESAGLIQEQNFFHWQVAFPSIWEDWEEDGLNGGFDAIIGNPPWDRMKLQQVEWFGQRRPDIANAQRASDRKALIKALEDTGDPLAKDYAIASHRAESANRVARACGDYPLLSSGDINLYSLFVERAMTLIKPNGVIGLLVPSGIASDKTAAKFFKGVSTQGRLKCLYDFENRRSRYDKEPFFPDVDSRFKFCVFVAMRQKLEHSAKCAFFLQATSEIKDPERSFDLTAEDFAKVNPNTGTAPIFRNRRDADLTKKIYANAPILVNRANGKKEKTWPVKYLRMFDMTNNSHLFRKKTELEEKEGAWPIGGNHYQSAKGKWVPLYSGRMIHQFDHRAASVRINEDNLHNPALSTAITEDDKANPNFLPVSQYWVPDSELNLPKNSKWVISFRDIARATDSRTMVASLSPKVGYSNKAPLLLFESNKKASNNASALLANLNSLVFDFVVRSKAHSTSINLYILEQLPIIPPKRFETTKFGAKTAAEVIKAAVLELTYTAHDMAPFAEDMGYIDDKGVVKPPFTWNDDRRLNLRAKLDAIFFMGAIYITSH